MSDTGTATLTMPLLDAISVSKALLNHVSTDNAAPEITHAAVIEYDGSRYLVATDRYSAGRYLLGAFDAFEGEFGQLIPGAALAWVSKIVPKGLRYWTPAAAFDPASGDYAIRWSWATTDSGSIEVEVAITFGGRPERSQTFDVVKGNFPPVARLFRDDTAGQADAGVTSITLQHSSLLKIAADVAVFGGKGAVTLGFGADTGTGKPKPVQYALGSAGRWTAIIQPSMPAKPTGSTVVAVGVG